MNILLRCLVIGSASLFFGCSGDPNEKANELYVQAVQLVESAKQAENYSAALPLYEQARDMLERIVSQYADSTIAVGLVSDQTKISNVALSEFRELEGPLKRYAKAEQDPLSCALVVAGTVQREYRRIKAVIDIARVLVKAGQAKQATLALSQALDLANAIHAIEDEYTKARALVDIANESVELGQPEQAGPLLSQALDIANTYPRWEEAIWVAAECNEEPGCGDFEPRSATVSLFVDIAGGLTKVGQTEQAGSLLLQAFHLSDRIHWSFIKGRNLAEIVTGLVEAGQFTQAIVVAKTIRGENGRGTALQAIERALVEAGQTEQTDSLLSQTLDLINTYTFREEEDKARAVRGIADALARAGRVTQSLDLANALKDEYQKASVLVAIAGELTKAGQAEQAEPILTQALAIANALKEANDKALVLVAIAGELTKAGQVTQALAVANTLKGQKAPALMTIAGELTKAGQAEQAGPILIQALAFTNALKDGYHKARSLVYVARRLTEAGQAEQARSILSQALNVANTVKNDYWKALAVANIVGELTEASQFTQALAIANTIKEADDKDSAIAAIARVLTETGQFTQALAVAKGINEVDKKDLAVAAIARRLTEAGQFTQALVVAKTIKNEYRSGYEQKYRKALALADIASGFVKAGHQPSESDIAILRTIVQTAMPMEKAWERLGEHSPTATNKE